MPVLGRSLATVTPYQNYRQDISTLVSALYPVSFQPPVAALSRYPGYSRPWPYSPAKRVTRGVDGASRFRFHDEAYR